MTDQQSSQNQSKKASTSDKILTVSIIVVVILLVAYNIINFYGASLFLKGNEFKQITGTNPYSSDQQTINVNETVVVNFWATWCGGCISELPELEKVANDVKIIGVLKNPVDIDSLKSMKLPWTNIIGSEKLLNDFMISAVPTTLLIRNNKIEQVKVGVITAQEIRSWLEN